MFRQCIGSAVAACVLLGATAAHGQVAIPPSNSWIDHGVVMEAGPLGQAWDAIMEDYTPSSIVKKDGTFYLYYVGSDDYIDQLDNIGPGNRFMGVATSTDGINWTKYPDNPVLTYSVAGNPEEGVPAAGFFLDTNGDFISYYSASHAATATTSQIWSDIRVARSTDGFTFTDEGLIARYNQVGIFGQGDELHPVMGYTNGTNYYAFYIPNGVPQTNRLGASWGAGFDSLTQNGPVLNGEPVPLVRGPGSIVDLGDDTLAFFNSYLGDIYFRTASATDPVTTMTGPLGSIDVPGHNGIVHLDQDSQSWFLYYNLWHSVGMMIAPMGDPDATGPLAPPSPDAAAVSHDTVHLQWGAATDPETGVLHYNVYRDGLAIGTTRGLDFTDAGPGELTNYNYEIRPVNLHGTEGTGAAVNLTTPADVTPATIHRAAGSGDNTVLTVVFDEPMDPATAGDAGNYALSHGVQVLSASLGPDGKTVTLTTTPQQDDVYYTLMTDGVRDASAAGNAGSPQWNHTFSDVGGLVGLYLLDASVAALTDDTSGYGHHGQSHGDPQAVASPRGGAMHFNGLTDFVEIDDHEVLDETFSGSFTVAAWVRPEDVPVWTTAINRAYSVFTSPNMTIEYDNNQKFFARINTTDGQVTMLTTETFEPGQWHHLALVVDADSGELSLYVDGVLVGGSPVSFTGDLLAPPSEAEEYVNMLQYYAQYRIGVQDPHFSYESNYFHGAIDDVRIFNQALSGSEVMAVIPEPASAALLLLGSVIALRRRRGAVR